MAFLYLNNGECAQWGKPSRTNAAKFKHVKIKIKTMLRILNDSFKGEIYFKSVKEMLLLFIRMSEDQNKNEIITKREKKTRT